MEFIHSLFYFVVAVSILVAFHEFGHFWVARKTGVKVLRFSIGFGRSIWSYQKTPEATEYVVSAIPLGGYVKMVDEREGEVKTEDLPFSFNRQPLWARSAIVAAGPIFNLVLAVFLFWCVFVIGDTGIRPIIGEVASGTLAERAGLQEMEEILRVNEKPAPTWAEAISLIFSEAMNGESSILLTVKTVDESEVIRAIPITDADVAKPDDLFQRLGLIPWAPKLEPVVGKIIESSAANEAGLEVGDIIVNADNVLITSWMQWVEYVQERPATPIKLTVDRDGVYIPLQLTPQAVQQEDKTIGRIGAGVQVPEDLLEQVRVIYTLTPIDALVAAADKTWVISIATLKMMGKMIVGKASVKNLSGPISIAQYAGQSAEMGLVSFLKYLALISVSLGVLNLLPIPVLDGGHLLFFGIEAVKGSPVSEQVQIYFQQLGIVLLMTLMIFAVFLDLERLFQ
jgi:regulator of sigma E protease